MLKLAEQMKTGTLISNTFTFSFRKGGHNGEVYSATFRPPAFVYKALCYTMLLHITSVENPRFSYLVNLDVEKKISAPLANSSLLERNFAKAFLAELGPEDWIVFNELNFAKRTKTAEEFTDFTSLEVDFTVHVYDIEQEKLTLSYYEVFAYALRPEIIYEGERYALDEQYSIDHDAKYENCLLVFMVLENGQNMDPRNPKTQHAWYFYDTQTLESVDSTKPVDQAFFAEVKKQLPDLAALVKKRHAALRLVYENYCKRENLHFPAPTVTDFSLESFFPTPIIEHQVSRPLASKVGRNDPCPCGSGKKYKKCCMLNTSS